ncbi:MAG: T9SS type A sorting domain-containing protein, partial [Bacteroidales bacterium]|nr:T9SS type A sorting domain-containing protein [Bacteroidales bacterium]
NDIAAKVEAKIYPNPAKNSINILLPLNLGRCTISLHSVSGKIVKTFKSEISAGNPVSVDLTSIKSGIYIINITSASTTFSQKIVVE